MSLINHTICMFGGSWPGDDEAYSAAARCLGRLTAELGWTLLYGGGGHGLMGQAARGALGAGGRVIGVVPEAMRHLEGSLNEGEEIILTRTLGDRKDRMVAASAAFVVLPGGLGTFDEFFEVVTAAQLGFHGKPIVLVDVEDYFTPLIDLLRKAVSKGFAPDVVFRRFTIVKTPEAAVELLSTILTGSRSDDAGGDPIGTIGSLAP